MSGISGCGPAFSPLRCSGWSALAYRSSLPDAAAFGVIGGLLGGLVVLVWWAFFSRVPRAERWGGIVLMIIAVAATPRILHQSIVGGMMGMMFPIYVIPGLSLALVAWAVISRFLAVGPRRVALAAAIFAGMRSLGARCEPRASQARAVRN